MDFIRNFFARRKLRGEKGSLRELFFNRSEHFINHTMHIIEKMPGALEAISDMIEEKETFKSGGGIEWSEISLVAAETENPLIVLIGSVIFPPGTEVELRTGERVTVTEDTAQYFPPRMVRVGIPLRLAEASKDAVKEYLKKTEEMNQQDSEQFMKNLKEAFLDDGNDDQEEEDLTIPVKFIKKQDTITTDADFDLTQLTDEQRKQLEMSQKIGRG